MVFTIFLVFIRYNTVSMNVKSIGCSKRVAVSPKLITGNLEQIKFKKYHSRKIALDRS